MGAWAFVQPYIDWVLEQMGQSGRRPRYVGRPASAATATGLMRKHLQELQDFLEDAYAG
jgi:2-oxoglutarate dehydrogenase E1 component